MIGSLGVILVVLETTEHLDWVGAGDLFYFGEILAITLLLGLTAFLARMLLVSLAEKSQAVMTLRLKHDLGMHLSSGQDVAEVSRRLVQQIAVIVPSARIALYLYEKINSWFMPVVQLAPNDPARDQAADFPIGIDPYLCRHCLTQNQARVHPLQLCRLGEHSPKDPGTNGYCLPLTQGARPIGLLQLHAPSLGNLTTGQLELLETIAGVLSSSLYVTIEKKTREEETLAQKIHSLQLEIARDLHDTIGQNITYLQMKLYQLSEKGRLDKAAATEDLQHMCAVADETYDLVRGTLAVLQSGSSADLLSLFARYADQVTERSTFQIDFASHGQPKSLSPHLLRQLFYVFREALSNIEKHAAASQASVKMTWDEDSLALVIADNGRGFDPAHLQICSHYGLKFMRERIEQMNGSLSILSAPGAGARLVVHVPVERAGLTHPCE